MEQRSVQVVVAVTVAIFIECGHLRPFTISLQQQQQHMPPYASCVILVIIHTIPISIFFSWIIYILLFLF